jgi:hypothetical protein
MSKAFKPGDPAMIINAANQDNIGKVVDLVRCTNDHFIPLPEISSKAWSSNLAGATCWVVSSSELFANSIRDGVRVEGFGVLPESWLMPLRDDDLPAETLDTAAPRELVGA